MRAGARGQDSRERQAWRGTQTDVGKTDETVTIIYPADTHCVTMHGKWRRLEDGRIEATYTLGELLWARMAVGYEPTVEELKLAARL